VQGNGFYLSVFDMSFLADHFYPWLLLFVPFYYVYSSPVWLFIGQAIVVMLMVYPILKIAEDEVGKKGMYLVILLLFTYLPFRMMASDIHGEHWLAMLFSWVLYSIYYEKNKLLYFFVFLLPFAKESAASIIVSIGIYFVLIKRSVLKGCLISLWGIVTSLLVIKHIIPAFGDNAYMYASKYSYLGETIADKLLTLLTNPHVMVSNVFTMDKLVYVFLLFAPLCFLSLKSSFIVLLFGSLMQNILSNYWGFYDITAHYTFTMIPVLFISAIIGYSNMKKNDPELLKIKSKRYRKIIIFFICLNLIYFIFFELRNVLISNDLKPQYEMLKKIPKDASVSTDANFFGHLQYRNNIYRLTTEHDSSSLVSGLN